MKKLNIDLLENIQGGKMPFAYYCFKAPFDLVIGSGLDKIMAGMILKSCWDS